MADQTVDATLLLADDHGLSTEAAQAATTAAVDAIAAALAGTLEVNDDYTGGETLADQSGAGVHTFTFAAPVDLVIIHPTAAGCRADPFGGTPSATAGVVLLDDAPNMIPVTAATVDVYAPSGTVSVWGFRH